MSEPTNLHRVELWELICGKELGRGASRVVYEHRLDPYLVIKAEMDTGEAFQNVTEWQAWQAVRYTEHARWLAPCEAISKCGKILLQRRTTPAANHPERIPAFLTDTKLANYGILTPRPGENPAQFVCHDYGLHMLLERGMTKRTVRAGWWNEQ